MPVWVGYGYAGPLTKINIMFYFLQPKAFPYCVYCTSSPGTAIGKIQ